MAKQPNPPDFEAEEIEEAISMTCRGCGFYIENCECPKDEYDDV